MNRRVLSDDQLAYLKTSFRRLIRAAGGVDSAARATRVNKSQLSNYQNANMIDVFPPIDVVAALEADTGLACVTEVMADMAGGYFIRIPSDAEGCAVNADLARIGKEMADVFARAHEALANGVISRNEADGIDEEVAQAIKALITLRKTLEKVAA